MKTTLIQLNSTSDKEKNISELDRLIDQALDRSETDVLVLPEMFSFIGGNTALRHQAAENINEKSGEIYEKLQELAKQKHIYIHAGSICEKEGRKLFNTTIVFDRQGEEIAKYRKIHLFDISFADGLEYKESEVYTPGDKIVTYEIDGVKIGCAICYDIRFSELFISLVNQGVKIIMLPAAFSSKTGKDHWDILCQARAIETQCYLVAPAQCGTFIDDGVKKYFWGHSVVVDPWGKIITQASDDSCFIHADLDIDYVDSIRKQHQLHSHRRL